MAVANEPFEDVSWIISRDTVGGHCVKISRSGGMVYISDTHNPDEVIKFEAGALKFTVREWEEFMNQMKQIAADQDNTETS